MKYQKAVFFLFLLFTHLSWAKSYFAINEGKRKLGTSPITIHQIKSEQGYDITNIRELGRAKTVLTQFSEDAKYMVVSLIQKRKIDDTVIIYLTDDMTELKRITIGKIYTGDLFYTPKIHFTSNGELMLITVKQGGKHMLHAYDVQTGQLRYEQSISKKQVVYRIGGTDNLLLATKTVKERFSKLQIFHMESWKKIADIGDKKHSLSFIMNDTNMIVEFKQKKAKVVEPYRLEIINTTSGQVLNSQDFGTIAPIFSFKTIPEDPLYFISYIKGETDLKLYKIDEEKIVKLASTNERVTPTSLIFDKSQKHFMVLGRQKSTFIDLTQEQQSGLLNNPFGSPLGFFSNDGSLVYLRESLTGSDVGIIDFNKRKKLKEFAAGRAGVKFGQFMAAAIVGTVGAYYTGYTGYYSAASIYSNTNIITDRYERFIYAINTKTNDVTILDLTTLKNKRSIEVGSGPLLLSSLSKNTYPEDKDGDVFVISNSKVNYFDLFNGDRKKVIPYQSILGVDIEQNVFFCLSENNELQVYRLADGMMLRNHVADQYFSTVINHK